MGKGQYAARKSLGSQLFLLPLLLGCFLTFTFTVFLSNSMVNVAVSLQVTVGTASQILTISSIVGLIVGFVMGFLTVRFNHKSMFMLGVALFGAGALGGFFAPDFASLLFFSFFLGTGTSITGIVVFALIGDFLPLEKKAMAVGLATASAFAANLVVPQINSAITNAAGWREVLLWFIFPISVAVLLFGFLVLPSRPQQERTADKSDYLKAFKGILLNKSALACVLANLLISISCLTPVYAVSFYTLIFNDSLTTSATYYSLASAMGIFGVLIGGRLINRIGRKPLVVATFAVQGVFATLIVFMPNSLASAIMWMISAFFASAGLTGLTSLALEQVPDFRGTMMSLNTSFQNIGLIVGLVISGLILNLYSNSFLGLYVMFGTCGIASAAVLYLFSGDPCSNRLQ